MEDVIDTNTCSDGISEKTNDEEPNTTIDLTSMDETSIDEIL